MGILNASGVWVSVHEVFAIQNIDKPFKTEDGIIIQALAEPDNMRMIAVVGDKTSLDTTTKTGYRLCVPMLAPTHPDLIERLGIKSGKPPEKGRFDTRGQSGVISTRLTTTSPNRLTATFRADKL